MWYTVACWCRQRSSQLCSSPLHYLIAIQLSLYPNHKTNVCRSGFHCHEAPLTWFLNYHILLLILAIFRLFYPLATLSAYNFRLESPISYFVLSLFVISFKMRHTELGFLNHESSIFSSFNSNVEQSYSYIVLSYHMFNVQMFWSSAWRPTSAQNYYKRPWCMYEFFIKRNCFTYYCSMSGNRLASGWVQCTWFLGLLNTDWNLQHHTVADQQLIRLSCLPTPRPKQSQLPVVHTMKQAPSSSNQSPILHFLPKLQFLYSNLIHKIEDVQVQ